MSGPLWLFLFLFILPLVSPLSIDDANCRETQACLQMNFCKDEIQSISYLESEVNTNFTCEVSSHAPTWTVFRFDPQSENEWRIEIYSNKTAKSFTVSFDDQLIETYETAARLRGTLHEEINVANNGFVEDKFTLINMTSDKSLYDQLMKGRISSYNTEGIVLGAEEEIQFKTKIFDLLRHCYITELNDGCENGENCAKITGNSYQAKCNETFWVYNGSSTPPKYDQIASILCKNGSWSENRNSLIDKREIICTARNPNDDICNPQEVMKKFLHEDHNVKSTTKNISCTESNAKIWILSDRPAENTNLIYCEKNKWKYGDRESLSNTDRFFCSEKEPVFCDIKKLNDMCDTSKKQLCTKMTTNFTQALCNKAIWINGGSAEQSNFIKIERIDCKNQEWIVVNENDMVDKLLGNRETFCSDHEPKPTQKEEIYKDSDFCNHRHLNEYCAGDCTIKMAHHNVTCTTKLWIDTGSSAFTRHWLSVNKIKCENGKWKWKDDSGTDWNSIGEMEVACSATSLPQTKPLLYGTVGGSIGLLIIILIVVIIFYKRRSKSSVVTANTEKSKTNTEKSTDKGSLILGVAVDPTKAEMKTWNWPEETEGTQIGSRPEAKTPPSRPDQNIANSPQPEALTETPDKKIKDTKFINVTESPTKNSSRKARRSKENTVNVTESPKNSSRKARRPKGKTGDVPESPKNSSRKILRPKGKTGDVNVSPKRKSDRPKKGKTTREDVLW